MERYNGDTQVRHSSTCGALLDDCKRGGTSFTIAHVTSGPLNRIGNRKRETRVLPIHPDREKKVHPFGPRVKLATHTEMRHPERRRQRGVTTRTERLLPASPAASASVQPERSYSL